MPDKDNAYRMLRRALPTRAYLKLYAWTLLIITCTLGFLTWLSGRYTGWHVALTGAGIILLMLVISFGAALIAGIALHLIDREP